MSAKLVCFAKKHWNMVLYVLFGILTTLVNWLIFLPFRNSEPVTLYNGLAWVVSVFFAFITNKPFVFKSYDWSAKVVLREAFNFYCCRLTSILLESAAMVFFVDMMAYNAIAVKAIVSVAVIIINYVGSVLIFKHSTTQK